jgi:hypothetical protein
MTNAAVNDRRGTGCVPPMELHTGSELAAMYA